MGSFAATVGAWVEDKPALCEAIYKLSVQRVLSAAQYDGNMPVATGFLRASLTVDLGLGVPAMTYKPDGIATFTYDETAVNLTVNGATIDTPVTAAWTANYARPVNYGARGRPGRKFRDLAAQRWPSIVAEVSREAQTRAGG